jgi:pyridoxine 5-phosphate synthase
VRRLTLGLDSLPTLRQATGSREIDLAGAAALARLAGVDDVRLSVNDDLKPVREEDVREARRAARRLELRMPPHQTLLKVALEARPDRVLLAASGREGAAAGGPLDLRGPGVVVDPLVRSLAEAGIPCAILINPDNDSVKRVHGEGVPAVEFSTRAIVDLPQSERRVALERLSDAVRLASKLHLEIGIGGGLGFETVSGVLEACPAVNWVAVGRAAVARAMLVGLDRALRDLRALVQ